MKRFFANLSLNTKFVLFTLVTLLVTFLGLAIYIYEYQQGYYEDRTDTEMYQHLDDLSRLVKLEYRYREDIVKQGMQVLRFHMQQLGRLQETKELLPLALTNEENKNKTLVNLPRWEIGGQQIQGSIAIVDSIHNLTGADVSIYQKTNVGFARISTTERSPGGQRLEGYYISPESPISLSIEQGKPYLGRIKRFDRWYIAYFTPLTILDEVKGMLSIAIPEKDLSYLRRELKSIQYFRTGYPFIMSYDGEYVVHPYAEGKKETDLNFLEFVQQKERGRYSREQNNEEQLLYFSYYEPYDLVIGAYVDRAEAIDLPLKDLRRSLAVSFLLALIIGSVGISLLVRSNILKPIQRLAEVISDLARGRSVEPVHFNQNDEIGAIAASANQLIRGFNQYSRFAQEIEKGNLEASFTPLSDEDILGKALLDMRDSIKEAAQRKQKEEWMNERLNHFNEVLRRQFENIEDFSARLLAEVVNEMGAVQGGMFLLNDETLPAEQQKLEMVACYAYNRHKRLQREVRPGEGLVGQVYLEGDTVNLLEIPEDYLLLSSGWGETEPRNILIVPLKTNDVTIGVLELASLQPFSQEQITLAEKVAQSIAATFFTVKNTTRTQQLLLEQQELTEQLRAQEEEMRQNLEELQATQEEMERSQKQLHAIVNEAQRKEELLSSLINNTQDLIVAIDDKYQITIFNKAAKDWFFEQNGVHLNNGANIINMLTVEQSEKFKEYFDRALLGERFSEVEPVQTPANTTEYWEYTFNPIKGKDDKPAGVSMFARNITDKVLQEQELKEINRTIIEKDRELQRRLEELTQAQQAIREKQEELEAKEAAIDSSAIAKIEMDIEGNILEANQTFCSLFQYEKEELEHMHHNKLVDAETLNSIEYLNFWRNLRNGISQHGQYKRITRYGESIYLIATYIPVRNEAGKVERIVQMAMDITAFVLREEVYEMRIARLQQDLEQCREAQEQDNSSNKKK
ncbi:Cache 3/Cache 2 fusion domain-containing protein [Thermonema rossianum]|uniref:Cache 3/Cache 2 fusion domain-containing protein n=1 Tax=Thermonema rossianum TaxID=55505 RepID=UPI00068F8C14|nr:Cache 3/Cache 2 fusion domain-containing protein [Thermonema rossianum]